MQKSLYYMYVHTHLYGIHMGSGPRAPPHKYVDIGHQRMVALNFAPALCWYRPSANGRITCAVACVDIGHQRMVASQDAWAPCSWAHTSFLHSGVDYAEVLCSCSGGHAKIKDCPTLMTMPKPCIVVQGLCMAWELVNLGCKSRRHKRQTNGREKTVLYYFHVILFAFHLSWFCFHVISFCF